MFVAGEHCDKETMEWTKKVFDCPVLDNWWQTGINRLFTYCKGGNFKGDSNLNDKYVLSERAL